jgi:flagellin-like hook-associated protein FlgL
MEVIMIGGVNDVTAGLATIYNANSRALSESLGRIASGKRIQKPSDDFAGYIRSRSLLNEASALQTVKQDLLEAKGAADYALETGTAIMDKLERCQELSALYAATSDTDEQNMLTAEHDVIVEEITALIAEAEWGAVDVVSTNTLANLDLDGVSGGANFEVLFLAADIPDESNLAIATPANVANELEVAAAYVARASGFSEDIQRHIDLTDIAINSKEAAASLITDIDEMKELAVSTDLQVRQQAAIAMMAQGNVSRQGILQLYM